MLRGRTQRVASAARPRTFVVRAGGSSAAYPASWADRNVDSLRARRGWTKADAHTASDAANKDLSLAVEVQSPHFPLDCTLEVSRVLASHGPAAAGGGRVGRRIDRSI